MPNVRPEFHLAQVNIGILQAPLTSPEIADFVALLDPDQRPRRREPGLRLAAPG